MQIQMLRALAGLAAITATLAGMITLARTGFEILQSIITGPAVTSLSPSVVSTDPSTDRPITGADAVMVLPHPPRKGKADQQCVGYKVLSRLQIYLFLKGWISVVWGDPKSPPE